MDRSHRVAWACDRLVMAFCWCDLEMVVRGGLALWLREGYGIRLLFCYGGRFNFIRGMVGILWSGVGNQSKGSSFVIV